MRIGWRHSGMGYWIWLGVPPGRPYQALPGVSARMAGRKDLSDEGPLKRSWRVWLGVKLGVLEVSTPTTVGYVRVAGRKTLLDECPLKMSGTISLGGVCTHHCWVCQGWLDVTMKYVPFWWRPGMTGCHCLRCLHPLLVHISILSAEDISGEGQIFTCHLRFWPLVDQ